MNCVISIGIVANTIQIRVLSLFGIEWESILCIKNSIAIIIGIRIVAYLIAVSINGLIGIEWERIYGVSNIVAVIISIY